ncbi:YbhB/YbcL family Raf kinase inhibitor-like protein [Chitinophaga parva]|uniref:YbhB/YbcL family Raf kinase inhibitor-like protein n=1 Tax=Chitinophaga parva TaxID=2169414 RepID=A0A2T7BEA8_9BACT|nr:YbhB/YbcL family Raf kinase inhibitor-like protein [Chitinophaga parva]PUZ23423.1 YbhB/YbcL family Raf kinase inhibitor-like protein [Chitinophaga parva]
MATTIVQLAITSPAFEHNGNIPAKYSCEGAGINPALHIARLPEAAASLALIVEDPDAPNGTFDHWICWNIAPAGELPENGIPGVSGKNSTGKTGYHPPCPPQGAHRYIFHVFALDSMLELAAGATRHDLEHAMQAHIIAEGSITGIYEKQGNK